MSIQTLHSWDVDILQAKIIQQQLQEKIKIQPLTKPVKFVAGADVSYSLRSNTIFAGIVILQYPDLIEVESAHASGQTNFPYIPGYLTFREAPILLKAYQQLHIKPDVIICDGQGIAHPRKMGIATHLGIVINIPTIGCAKSRLTGEHDLVPPGRGNFVPLLYKNEQIGVVLRTRTNIKPLYISPGHKITIEQSMEIVLQSCTKYRIPEPTRAAHLLVNKIRRQFC